MTRLPSKVFLLPHFTGGSKILKKLLLLQGKLRIQTQSLSLCVSGGIRTVTDSRAQGGSLWPVGRGPHWPRHSRPATARSSSGKAAFPLLSPTFLPPGPASPPRSQHPHGPPCVLPLVVDLPASLKAMVPRGGGHRSAAAASPGAPSPGRTHAPVPWCPCEQRRPEQEVGSREGPSSARDLPDRNSVSRGCHKTSLRVLWK